MSAVWRRLHNVTWPERYPPERLVPYDPLWVDQYARLAAPLRAALGVGWFVEHVGSTSVPGLSAKPVIDLAVGEPPGHDISCSIETFRGLGWTAPIPLGDHRATFVLKGTVRVAIAHVFTHEQWDCAHVRLFAEWLRAHGADRDEYQRLKSRLVANGVWGSDYTQSKAEFVLAVVNHSRAQRGLSPVKDL